VAHTLINENVDDEVGAPDLPDFQSRGRSMTKTLRLLLVAVLATTLLPLQPQASQSGLQQLVDEVTAYRRTDQPLPVPAGTDRRYDDRFEAVSVERFERERLTLAAFQDRLRALDVAELSPSAAIDARILGLQLRDRIAEIELRGYLLPLGSRSGFHFGFASAPESGSFDDVGDYDRYIARMQSFLEHTRGQIDLMREGIAAGWVMPAVIMRDYADTAGQHVVESAEDSAFARPLRNLPAAVTPADRERIVADGMEAIASSVLPAYGELERFFLDEYIPAARPGIAIAELPGGEDFYAHRVRRYTTLDLTAAEVHEIGLDEVARMRAEMDAIRAEVGFDGDHLELSLIHI